MGVLDQWPHIGEDRATTGAKARAWSRMCTGLCYHLLHIQGLSNAGKSRRAHARRKMRSLPTAVAAQIALPWGEVGASGQHVLFRYLLSMAHAVRPNLNPHYSFNYVLTRGNQDYVGVTSCSRGQHAQGLWVRYDEHRRSIAQDGRSAPSLALPLLRRVHGRPLTIIPVARATREVALWIESMMITYRLATQSTHYSKHNISQARHRTTRASEGIERRQ